MCTKGEMRHIRHNLLQLWSLHLKLLQILACILNSSTPLRSFEWKLAGVLHLKSSIDVHEGGDNSDSKKLQEL